MKKFLSIFFALIMLASVLTVSSSARGYTLSFPSTVSAHDLNTYGLATLEVYSTAVAPSIDGVIGTGEYPGPNNGCCHSVVLGEGMWMSAASQGNNDSFSGNLDFTGYTAESDVPDYINIYLTYDDDYLYFAVTSVLPAQSSSWNLDTWLNFMQSTSLIDSYSRAWNRYNMTATVGSHQASSVSVYTASQSTKTGRMIRQLLNGKDITNYLDYYIDDSGTTWNGTTYRRAENYTYNIDVLENGRWYFVGEGRMPLGDVLRITDVEYEDGTPIDYVPEWGTFIVNFRYLSSADVTGTAPNGSDVVIYKGQRIAAQTMLPTYGTGYTSANSRIGEYVLNNTVQSALSSRYGVSVSYLSNPVHYLGAWDETFDYDSVYAQVSGEPVASTSRVLRTRAVQLTSAVAGVNGRVVGIATAARPSSATGDDPTLMIVLVSVMALCAVTALVVVVTKKRRDPENGTK